jgi:hypothetical protein
MHRESDTHARRRGTRKEGGAERAEENRQTDKGRQQVKATEAQTQRAPHLFLHCSELIFGCLSLSLLLELIRRRLLLIGHL